MADLMKLDAETLSSLSPEELDRVSSGYDPETISKAELIGLINMYKKSMERVEGIDTRGAAGTRAACMNCIADLEGVLKRRFG